MEELQSWWEVPTIAHFCHVFQAAFSLFPFEIEELESALLQNNDNPYCVTIEQLAMRLVKGCLVRKSVTSENWEELLHKLLERKVPRENKIEHIGDFDMPFNVLHVRKKVEILLKLCELRLDRDEAADAIKNIDSNELRIEPVGTDSGKNVYFYFFGLRLYKENLTKLAELKKKRNVASKIKVQTPTNHKKGTRSSKRFNGLRTAHKMNMEDDSSVSDVSSAWSVACHTMQDWESLIEKFKNSRNDKQLGHILEKKYLPMISELIAKRERLERKKLLELAPRRTSSRIEKVRQQREIEQAAAEHERLQKLEKERQRQAFEEENRKKQEKEERAKRVEERRLAMEERARRAQLRQFRNYYENVDGFGENSGMSNDSRSRSPVFQNGHYQNESEEYESSRNSAVVSEGFQGSNANSERCSEGSQGSGVDSDEDSNEDSDESSCNSDVSSAQNDAESSDSEKSGSEDEDSDAGDDSSHQLNTPGNNKICDTTVNSGFHNIIYARSKDSIPYQNVQQYSSRNFQQVNTTSIEQHAAHKTIRTYSKLDHQLFARSNPTNVRPEIPVSKTITVNFISNIPQNATIIRPIIYHPSTS